jgi:hypothetical protein
MVWPGARQCNDNRACLNYPMLLSLGGGSHIKRRSHYSPIGLVFWGDWAFPRGVHRSTMLRLPRFRLLGPSGHLRPDQYEHMLCAWTEAGSLELFFSFLRAILDTCCSGFSDAPPSDGGWLPDRMSRRTSSSDFLIGKPSSKHTFFLIV